MKIIIFIIFTLFSIPLIAQDAESSASMSVNCKVEYFDEFEKKTVEKEFPVTLSGHFDQPEEKCKQACGQDDCKLLEISI